jgi:hypothetical protein
MSRIAPILAALLVCAWPGRALAADFAWADGRLALPVFLLGAAAVAGIGRLFGNGRFKALGVALWLLVVSLVGTFAVFTQQNVFKSVIFLIAFLVGAAIFLPFAVRAILRIDPPDEAAEKPGTGS